MAFQRPTLSDIYNRMKADAEARLTGGAKVPRFSLLGVLLAVFAGAIHLVYGFLVWFSKQFFPETAEAEYLIDMGSRYGLSIKAATYATGSVRFDGTPGTVIPSGTTLQDTNGTEFATIAEATVPGGGSIFADIQCSTAGTIGNITATTLQLSHPIPGITTEVAITTALSGGTEEETVEEFRLRVIQRTANPPASGTAEDYVRWAQEVAGVGRAWCLTASEYQGAGTVGVVIATDDLTPVDAATHTRCTNYLESVRPIGPILTVEDVEITNIGFQAHIRPCTTETQEAVVNQLKALFLTESEPGGTIYLSHINAAMMASGIEDFYFNLFSQDGHPIPVANIVATGFKVPTFWYAVLEPIT